MPEARWSCYNRAMSHKTPIIWDFDGTIMPNTPLDSEQELLSAKISSQPRTIFGRGLVAFRRAVIWADRRGYLLGPTKAAYLWGIYGATADELDRLCRWLAGRIPSADRRRYRELAALGHEMVVVSCGTWDLSTRVLAFAGIADCFGGVAANRLLWRGGQVVGQERALAAPEAKIEASVELGVRPDEAIVVGDGFSDVPLLDAAKDPVLMDRGEGRAKLEARGYRRARCAADVA